jgi:cell division protein FtsB
MNSTTSISSTPTLADLSTLFTPTVFSHPSPAPSSSEDDHEAGPSRKRARTDMTPEQRKEARAHRNRIAAQNSRDKRKAEFGHLHSRVADLEAENARLRAHATNVNPSAAAEQSHWEQENAALRERIRTLEKGWDVIIKALAAQGLPAGLLAAAQPQSQQPTSTTISPMMVPSSPVYPPTPSSISHMSLSPSFVTSSPKINTTTTGSELPESARHLARVATAVPHRMASLQRADSTLMLKQPQRRRCTISQASRASRRTTVLRALRQVRLRATRKWPTSSPASSDPRTPRRR